MYQVPEDPPRCTTETTIRVQLGTRVASLSWRRRKGVVMRARHGASPARIVPSSTGEGCQPRVRIKYAQSVDHISTGWFTGRECPRAAPGVLNSTRTGILAYTSFWVAALMGEVASDLWLSYNRPHTLQSSPPGIIRRTSKDRESCAAIK
jgi:hypothetical protein